MNIQKRKYPIKAQTNIRVIREGNQRLSDRRPQFLIDEKPESKTPSFESQSFIKRHSNKMPSSEHHSFHSANEADRLLDLSAASSSSMSVKSCFGSFGTLKVKVPVSSLREVQNLPENLEINSTSTPRSLSPECGPKKQVLVEKHSPCQKSFPSSQSLSSDFKIRIPPNSLQNKTGKKEIDLSDTVVASLKHKQPEIVTFSEQTSENSSKLDVLSSDDIKEEDGREAISDQKLRPIRVYQGSVATGKMWMQKKIPNNNTSVQITNFSASDSLAARKALVAKKTQNAPVPVRRAVPAKAITSSNQSDATTEKKGVCHSCQEKSLLPDAVSAVAAATAAALSTQPLISSQNKLESQLSILLEKINTLEQEAALKQKELENEGKTQKIAKLETQLNQVTEERMKHLEQLQKQLFGMQTKFLSIARSFEKISDADTVYSLQPQTQKPTQTSDENNAYLNSSLNTCISQEIKNNPSMNSGFQTLSVPLDRQNSITEDKSSLRSSVYEDTNSKSANSEKIRTMKHFNINNSGKLNMSSVGHHRTAKNIYAPFLEKKPKVQDPKALFSGKTCVTSMSSKSKENMRQKSNTIRDVSKSITQKNPSSVRNKIGSQQKNISKMVESKHSKEKQSKSDVKSTSEIKQSSSVPVSSRYSVLKDFVSGRYSQQPYVVRETDNIPNSDTGRILNASYTVDDPIVEKDDASKEHFSQVETNKPELNKEAPLEKYLLQSPDKSQLFTQDKIYSGQQPSLPSAEVLAGQEILRKAQTSRMVLEANLQMVERDHEKDAVYGLVDNLYAGSPATHRLQLRRKVDQCIAKVQKDIQNELSQAESLHSPSGKTKSQKSTRAPNFQKAPVANKKVLVNKVKCQDSEYLAQVFGKAAYQNKRTTVRNPYLRLQNNPKPKSPRPKETVSVKGIQIRSAKTQTSQEKEKISKSKVSNQQQKPVHSDDKKYFFASASNKQPSSVNLQHGHLGYMAVALREPRMDSGLKVPVTIRAGDSLTMAPEDQPKIVPAHNVMVCNIPVCDEEHMTKKQKVLVKQTLPSVIIEAQQEMSQPCKTLVSDTKPSAEEPKMISHKNIIISDEDLDKEIDAYSSSSESVAASDDDEKQESLIIISGSNSKLTGSKTYKSAGRLVEKKSVDDIFDSLHNQDFVPLVPFVPEANLSRESPERNHLPNEILQWIEQEITSQIFSYSSQQPPLPSSDFVPKTNASNPENAPTVPSNFQASTNSSLVDKTLISQLVEELLVDKVNDMIKETLAENNQHPAASDPASLQNESISTTEKIVLSPQTPELTPDVSEEIVASPDPNIPLPHTPSVSPEMLEENLLNTEPSSLNDPKVEKCLLHAALKQEINKLREEESFQGTHTEEAGNLDPVVTPQQTPSLTPVQNVSPVTPVSSPTFPPELLNENIPIRTPSPSIFSPDHTEEAVNSRQSELHLTPNQDDIPPIKKAIENDTSLKDAKIDAVEVSQCMKHLESASPVETSSVSTTQSESETIFESLSVGQWLLSKSEGEAADFGISEKAYQQILNDASTASTLRDTEDLFHDETTEMTYSEGEVVYKNRVPPEKDPILELVSQMQNRNPLTIPAAVLLLSNDEKSAVRRSLGEFPLIESELDPVMDPPGKSLTDFSFNEERKPLKLQQPVLAQTVTYSDLEEENLSEKEICPPQKGARVIEVGKRVVEPSTIDELASSKCDPTKWKVIPSRIEVGSMSDSDQINFMQKSVRFNEDSHMSSVDYAAYLGSSSDLVASDMEKFSVRSSHESVPSHEDIFHEEPKKHSRMSVMIPQPDILDEEDIEEISLGEEK